MCQSPKWDNTSSDEDKSGNDVGEGDSSVSHPSLGFFTSQTPSGHEPHAIGEDLNLGDATVTAAYEHGAACLKVFANPMNLYFRFRRAHLAARNGYHTQAE